MKKILYLIPLLFFITCKKDQPIEESKNSQIDTVDYYVLLDINTNKLVPTSNIKFYKSQYVPNSADKYWFVVNEASYYDSAEVVNVNYFRDDTNVYGFGITPSHKCYQDWNPNKDLNNCMFEGAFSTYDMKKCIAGYLRPQINCKRSQLAYRIYIKVD